MSNRTLIGIAIFCVCLVFLIESGLVYKDQANKLTKEKQELTLQLDNLAQKLSVISEENNQLKKALQECKGGTTGIKQTHLKGIITSVLAYLGEKNIKDWTRLLCLTIATESNMGQLTKQIGGPARGITQVEPNTEKETLAWLSKHHPKTFEALRKLRVPAKVGIHEAEYNMAYSIGLAYGVYRMKKADPSKKSAKELAKLYKKYYNTYKGKATIDGVMTKVLAYNIKL